MQRSQCNTIKIYSKNATFQKFEVLKSNRNKRWRYHEFFVEGVRNINEAIQNNWHIVSFLYSGERSLSSWAKQMITTVETEVNYELHGGLMAELSSKEDTSELLAIIKMRDDSLENLTFSDNPLIVLFDRPSNRGNLGTIIRSCDSFGVDALILTGHGVDLYDKDVIAASMGSFFKLPVVRACDNDTLFAFIQNIKQKYNKLQLVGTTAHRERYITQVDFTHPTLLLLGNETDGLSRGLKEYSDILATIPMSENSSASSFNVGCAATVILYEAIRQRL